jgi:hypothetical protein
MAVNLLGQEVRIVYSGRATSLGDVVLNLWDTDNVQVLTSQVMTELGSTKIYYYDYTPLKLGDYTGYIDSATTPMRLNVSFHIDGRAISPVSSAL